MEHQKSSVVFFNEPQSRTRCFYRFLFRNSIFLVSKMYRNCSIWKSSPSNIPIWTLSRYFSAPDSLLFFCFSSLILISPPPVLGTRVSQLGNYLTFTHSNKLWKMMTPLIQTTFWRAEEEKLIILSISTRMMRKMRAWPHYWKQPLGAKYFQNHMILQMLDVCIHY